MLWPPPRSPPTHAAHNPCLCPPARPTSPGNSKLLRAIRLSQPRPHRMVLNLGIGHQRVGLALEAEAHRTGLPRGRGLHLEATGCPCPALTWSPGPRSWAGWPSPRSHPAQPASRRKLHCTRNYIHVHLFISFILRAASVFIKDLTLFDSEELDHCTKGSVRTLPSLPRSPSLPSHTTSLFFRFLPFSPLLLPLLSPRMANPPMCHHPQLLESHSPPSYRRWCTAAWELPHLPVPVAMASPWWKCTILWPESTVPPTPTPNTHTTILPLLLTSK